jgi:hypothetical protein
MNTRKIDDILQDKTQFHSYNVGIIRRKYDKDKLFSNKIYSALLMERVDPDTRDCNGNTLLLIALGPYGTGYVEHRSPNFSEALELIERGANIHAYNDEGMTALMLAVKACNCHYDFIEIMKQIIQRGADVDRVNKNNWTALMYAASEGYLDAAKLLIEAGADLNVVDKHYGFSPL